MRVREGMQIGVIGLGVAGISTVRHLLRAKALVRVSDMRSQEQLAKAHPDLFSFFSRWIRSACCRAWCSP